jgi:hypothetical protein
MNRIKRAWNGVKWSILRRNVGWAALIFTMISFLSNCSQMMNGGSLWFLWLSSFITFTFNCLFFTMVGLPYYFLRNLVFPPREIESE